ncbi:hypothetical protein FKY92_15055, partial [Enterococcus faecalis]|uniref:hypothetical protein n=1 Tax=Enterococcus faecalis TaxID=1351 RepID=UPI0011421084
MRKSSYKISVVVTLILQNGLSFYLPKISIYTKYFTLSPIQKAIEEYYKSKKTENSFELFYERRT